MILMFFIYSINAEAVIKNRWYRIERNYIGYTSKEECKYFVDLEDVNKVLIYEGNVKQIYEDEDIIEEQEERVLNREINKIKYIGLDNVITNNHVLILTRFELYKNNNIINSHYLNSNNTGNTSFFISNKSFIELYDKGYLILELNEEVDINDLKIELRLGNGFEIQNAVLFMGDDINNYTFYKLLDNNIETLSQHPLSSFNVDNTYKEMYYKYYKKEYMCYEEERYYVDGYYEELAGYIKDEDDFIEELDEEEKDEAIDEIPEKIKEKKYPTKISTRIYNNTYSYKYNTKYVYSNKDKKVNKEPNNTNIKSKIKKQVKDNNKNYLFLIILLVIFSMLFSLLYFLRRVHTK